MCSAVEEKAEAVQSTIKRESMWCELTNSSHRMSGATMTGWRIRRRNGRLRLFRCRVKISLIPGHSGRDHLFDRTLVEAEEQLQSTLVDDLRLSWRDGRPQVDIDEREEVKPEDAPAEIAAIWERRS